MDLIVGGFNLMLIIMGLVEWCKKLGVTGKASMVLAMVLGVVFGVAYQVYQNGGVMPRDFSSIFVAVVAGLATGLAASGFYDLGKKFLAGGEG